jgi:hypothetical protein
MGTNRATALLLLTIVIRSLNATRLSSRESCVLAS